MKTVKKLKAHGTPWTLTDRATLLTMLKNGKNHYEIAEKLNRTYWSTRTYSKSLVEQGLLTFTGRGPHIKYHLVSKAEAEKNIKERQKKIKAIVTGIEKTSFKTGNGIILKVKHNKKSVNKPFCKTIEKPINKSPRITYYNDGLLLIDNKLYKEIEATKVL